jgi:hypothetical protein
MRWTEDTERDPDHGQPMDGDGDATACTKGLARQPARTAP